MYIYDIEYDCAHAIVCILTLTYLYVYVRVHIDPDVMPQKDYTIMVRIAQTHIYVYYT